MDQKTQKYDRQLRLWGQNGQKRLEKSAICLLGASYTGCETLKNLILPGIGQFCIVDDRLVTGGDVGKNFFLEQCQIGRNLAESCALHLSELNTDVEAKFDTRSIQDWIKDHNEIIKFTAIIVSDHVDNEDLAKLSMFCRFKMIPLIVVRSYGFYGYCRLDYLEHTIVESHTQIDNQHLQLNSPPQKLLEFAQEFDLNDKDTGKVSHIPYPIILIQAMKLWKQKVGDVPLASKRKEFIQFVKAFGADLVDDENFQEAVKHQNISPLFNGNDIPGNIKTIINNNNVEKMKASQFWLQVAALEKFIHYEGQGRLPFSGIVPDMKSDTQSYVQLQKM